MVLIFRDIDGLPDRLATVRRTFPGEVVPIAPHHAPQSGAIPIEVPAAWLPTLPGKSRRYLEWFAADALGLAAVEQLAIDADHVWFVESDVWAPDAIWRDIFAATAAAPADFIVAKLLARSSPFARFNGGFQNPGNPDWITHTSLLGLYRLSRRALQWCHTAAEPLRECYSECRVASLVHRQGGSVRDLAEFLPYTGPRGFTGSVATQRFHPALMNHPVKIAIGKGAGD